jgi:hypothetical protein
MKKVSATVLVLVSAALLCGLQAQTNDWIKYNSPEGRYSILFPGEPKLSTQEGTTKDGQKFPQYLAASPDSSEALCMVGYFDVAPGLTFSFDDGRNGMVNAIKGILISEKAISIGGYTGRELKISATGEDGTDYIVRARFYQAGSRVYVVQLIVAKSAEGPVADAKSVKYFNSFQVTKPH